MKYTICISYSAYRPHFKSKTMENCLSINLIALQVLLILWRGLSVGCSKGNAHWDAKKVLLKIQLNWIIKYLHELNNCIKYYSIDKIILPTPFCYNKNQTSEVKI